MGEVISLEGYKKERIRLSYKDCLKIMDEAYMSLSSYDGYSEYNFEIPIRFPNPIIPDDIL